MAHPFVTGMLVRFGGIGWLGHRSGSADEQGADPDREQSPHCGTPPLNIV